MANDDGHSCTRPTNTGTRKTRVTRTHPVAFQHVRSHQGYAGRAKRVSLGHTPSLFKRISSIPRASRIRPPHKRHGMNPGQMDVSFPERFTKKNSSPSSPGGGRGVCAQGRRPEHIDAQGDTSPPQKNSRTPQAQAVLSLLTHFRTSFRRRLTNTRGPFRIPHKLGHRRRIRMLYAAAL